MDNNSPFFNHVNYRPMSKTALVEKIAEQAKLTKVDADRALKAFIAVVSESLKNGEDVPLVGFGTFSVVDRAERQGRNPKTGEVISISAKKVVKFKPGKALKDEVEG
ncbi:MAG: HU family DNA-binding protein [Chlorobium sp.]